MFSVLAEMGITVNFWHVADAGKDSVDLLGRLVNTFDAEPNYFVVKNQGCGSDFSQMDESPALEKALTLGARVRPQQPFRRRCPGSAGAPACQELVEENLRHAGCAAAVD